MWDKLETIVRRYESLEQELAVPGGDYQRYAALGKERADLEPLVRAYRAWRTVQDQLAEARQLLGSDDPEVRTLAEAEVAELAPKTGELELEIRNLLLPKDPRGDRNVILEIRAGTGGDEAGLFAADLFRMYARYAEKHGWKIRDPVDQNDTGIGGLQRGHSAAPTGAAPSPPQVSSAASTASSASR